MVVQGRLWSGGEAPAFLVASRRLPALEWSCGRWLASSSSAVAPTAAGVGEASVVRGCFPADVRSADTIPAFLPDGSCGTSTPLGCYRTTVGCGCAAVSASSSSATFRWSWSSAAAGAMVVELEGLQGFPCNFSVCQGPFCSFSKTGGLRVASSACVHVQLLCNLCMLFLNAFPFSLKKKLI